MCVSAEGSQETQHESATIVQTMPSRWNGHFAILSEMQSDRDWRYAIPIYPNLSSYSFSLNPTKT